MMARNSTRLGFPKLFNDSSLGRDAMVMFRVVWLSQARWTVCRAKMRCIQYGVCAAVHVVQHNSASLVVWLQSSGRACTSCEPVQQEPAAENMGFGSILSSNRVA